MTPTQERLDFAAPATRGASRHDGPRTSRAAGRSMTGPILRDQQAVVLEAVAGCGRANAHDVQRWLAEHGRPLIERNGIGSRFRELRENGWLRLLPDVQHERVGQVHEPTDAGRERLAAVLAERGES